MLNAISTTFASALWPMYPTAVQGQRDDRVRQIAGP